MSYKVDNDTDIMGDLYRSHPNNIFWLIFFKEIILEHYQGSYEA